MNEDYLNDKKSVDEIIDDVKRQLIEDDLADEPTFPGDNWDDMQDLTIEDVMRSAQATGPKNRNHKLKYSR